MLFTERKEDMYELSHINAEECNKNIDINLLIVFVADNYDDEINNLDRDFNKCIKSEGISVKICCFD